MDLDYESHQLTVGSFARCDFYDVQSWSGGYLGPYWHAAEAAGRLGSCSTDKACPL